MKTILNISVTDYANFGHDNAESLRAAGYNVNDVALSPHTFDYPECSKVVTQEELDQLIKQYDIIQVFHSPLGLAERLKATKKPVVIYHTGTGYRQQPAPIHKAYDGWVKMHVCALPELYEAFKSRSLEPCVYMVGGVAVHLQNYQNKTPFKVGHYPSNPDVKGTDRIAEVFQNLLLEGLPLIFDINTSRVGYADQIKRLKTCDIYVEMLAGMQGAKDYGSFGITALEAAAMGKIVITNCTHPEPYQKHYGAFPFIIANDAKELELALVELAELTPDELTELKISYQSLFFTMHTYKPTGKYIAENVLKGLL